MANFLNWLKDNLAKANNLDTNINNYEGTSANNVGNSAKATKTETKKAQKVSSGTSVSAGESLVQQAQPTKATQTKANNDVTFADGSKTQDLDNSQNFSEYVVKTLSNAKEKAKTTVKDVLSESYAKVPNYSDSDVDGILNTLKTNGYKTSTQDMEKAYNYITSVNPNQNHGDKYEEVKDLYKAINKIQEDEDVDSKAYSDVELDKDAQGNYIFDYSDQLQELYDLKEKNRTGEIRLTKEQVEDYKKQLKNVERKQEKANDIYITANKDQFLTNLDSQDKINTLKTYSSRNDNQIERVGNVTGKVANEIVATPWKLDKAIKSLNQDTAKNVATFNYANGLISKEEYDEMMSKNSIDLDDQELMVNRMQDRINLLNSQAYYGLTENQALALNVVESMENNYFNQFLFGKYMTAAMSVESATDKVNTLIAQGYDPAMAFANGIITGVFSAYTESDRFARTFERAADYLPGYALGDYFGNFATAFLNGAFGESVEEAAEWFVEPILDAATLGTPIEYNFGDLGRTIIVAGLSGGLQSGTSSINYSISTDKQANTIENEIKHLYKNIDAYTDTGKELVKRIANNGQLALNNYDASRVLPRGALVTESNQGETFLNYQEAMSRLDEMVKPDIENRQEAINSLQQSIESLKAVSQQVLNDNGIYFANGINEYYQVTDQGKQNIKNIQPVVNAAQEKGTQVVYTTQDKVTIDGKEYNVEQGVNFGDGLIIINPNKANVEGVVRHEIFHSFSRYEQSKLENIIKQTFGVDYWNNTNQQVKDVYDDSSIWNEETNAALIENAFGNQKFLQNLKNQDASLFKKAKDLVSYYVNKGILDAKYNSIFENAELLGNAAYSKEVYDDSVIKDPNNPKYYNYNNLIKLDDIDSVSVVVSKHYKIYKGNVNDIFNTMKNNYPSGVNGNQINVENIKTNEKFEITDKIVSHTSFNMNNRENVVALENLPILLETATPMMKSFETLNKNNNFTSYYNLFEYNDKPYIVRIITKDGVIDSLGTISPSVAYALNSNKKGSTPTSTNRFKNVGGRTRSAFTISINNLIKEINNDKRFYVDLSQNTRARLGLNNQKEFGKYTNKYSKPLEVSSKEDSDGDKVSKGMLDYMKGTKLTKDGALMKIYHTGKSLFEVFDPTNTIGYRFGPNVVNYYSNNQNVSGSYTNGEYKQINKANYEENEKAIDNYRTKQDEWNKAFKTYDDNKNVVGRKMFDYINNYRELFNGMDDILYEAAYGENKLDLNAYDQIMLEDYRDNIRQFLSSDTPSKAFSNGSYLTKLIDSYNNSVGKNTVSKDFVDLFNNNKNYVEMINEMKQYYDANNELYNDYQNINKELENYRKIVEGGNQYVGYGLAKNPYVINGNNTNWNEINNSDYWLDVDTMNKVGSDFIEMVNKEEENGDRDVYDILLSRKKKYKAEEFIINNMPNDSKQFLIDNPIVLANLTNIFYNPYTNIEDEVGYQFNRNVGVKQVDDVQKPIMKFGDKLETNDVVRAVLTINQYLKDNGQDTKYDGVVFESIRDSGSGVEGSYEPSDIIALFNSNQFKLIDNENPTTDKRIRYAKNLDEQENVGYHYGAKEFDYNKKSETLWRKSGSRNTGAYGTGTYFFGEQQPYNVYGYNDGEKTEHKVDFNDYNLFKPSSYSDGVKLHDLFLKDLDNNIEYDETTNKWTYNKISDHDMIQMADILNVGSELFYNTVYDALDQATIERNNNFIPKTDSVPTKVMKALGYDGIDVRGIKGLDNSTYGSVIYDLKPTTVRYSKVLDNTKVVDEEGKPKIVYQGANNVQGSNWFTDDYDTAKSFGKVNESYLNIKNPLVVDANYSDWNAIKINKNNLNLGKYDLNYFFDDLGDVQRQEIIDYVGGLKNNETIVNTNSLLDIAKINGYDGVIVYNVDETGTGSRYVTSYAVANKEQIIKNTLRYSKSLDNINNYVSDDIYDYDDMVSVPKEVVQEYYDTYIKNEPIYMDDFPTIDDFVNYADPSMMPQEDADLFNKILNKYATPKNITDSKQIEKLVSKDINNNGLPIKYYNSLNTYILNEGLDSIDNKPYQITIFYKGKPVGHIGYDNLNDAIVDVSNKLAKSGYENFDVQNLNNENIAKYSKPLDSEDKYVSYAIKRQERTIDDNLVNGGMNAKYLNNEDYLATRDALINNANETNGNIDVKYMADLKNVVENYLTIDENYENDSVDVRSYLKSNPINPSILDSEGLRKKNNNIFDDKNSTGIDRKDFMNKMRSIGVVWSNKGTTSVDTLAQELSDLYPQLSFLNDKTSHYDILNALYDYANNNKNNTKEMSLVDLYGQDAMNNFADNFKKAILGVDDIAKQINDQNRLTISDEDLSKFVKGKKLSDKTLATIQKYKTELADNAQDWIPNYDIIARRYPSFSKENLSTALFEIFENGNLSEETKNALRDNIIATEFYGNKEQYLNSKRTNEVNNLINDAIDYFSVDAKYQANQSELDKTANRANQYIKAYSGIDASQDIEQKFDDIKQMQDMEKRIKDAREKTSKSYVKTLQDMVTLAKDKISRWITLEQNLDVMASGALELRKGMQEVFELPKYQAQTTNAALLTEGDKYIQEKVKQGFREGSKESKATQWHLEGHTDELVELSQVEDPRTLSDQDSNKKVYKPFTEEDLKFQFNYKMSNGKYAYENIIEYAKELRERYDDLHYQINSTRINQIYGDIEGKNDLETTKLLAKVNTQNEVVKQLANRMVKEKPSVELQSAYNQAKQEFNKLANQYNKKIEKNQSNDSTRRQLVPYRQNYAPHVIEKGNFLQQLRNAINSENKTPTDLAGISDYAKPRSTFAGFMMAQEGGNYTADATAGFAQYIKEASRVIAYDPLVDYYRNIAKDLRDLTKGITLNDFDEYLNDYTNSLAGKTNEFDRGGKKMFGTKALKVVDVLNKRAKANSLMFNFRTMVVQAANLPNAMSVLQGNGGAKVTQDIARGTYNYLSSITNENALDKQSPFLTMRYADIDTGDLSFKAKAEKVANFMMEKVDEISTKAIWYSAYEQGVRKGVDDAIFYADDLTRRSVAGRDIGEVPLALQSKFINLAMPFQVETQNVWNTMGGLLKDKKFGAILTSLIAGWLMNNLYEKLFGDRPIFDPIDAIKDGIKASEGGEYQNLVTRLAGEVIGANPIATSAVSFALDEDQREKLFGEQDPTKYGTTNISVQALGKAIVQAYESKNLKSLETLLYAYGLPGGGTQAKRIVQTLQTYGILPQQVDGEWLSEPISYTDSGKIRYANDTEINAENVLDFMKQLAFGTWAGKQGQAYLEDGKYLSDSQSNIFDAFNSGLSAYQSYSLTKEYANIESLKDENGKTITNSEGLQKRALLQENGVWEDYKENNEAGKNNIGKTVYNMTDDEFQKAYEEVFGKAVEQPQETKETKNVEQEQSSMKDIFSGLFNKDETTEETPKETNIDNMESSTSGNLYPNGKKPTQEDYLNGLENFYEEGDYRYTPNNNGGYDLQEWNGSEFVTTKKNAIKGETKKVTEKEINNKTNKTTKEVTLQDAYEQTFTKAQINNYIKAMAGGKENSTYKAISNVLNKHVNGKSTKEVQDNIDEIRKSYKKAGVYEIVKKYLKNHPYVDARKFGL